MAARTEEQGYSYSQLRTTIDGYIRTGNTLGFIGLLTADNFQVISNCAPELLGTEDQGNIKLVSGLSDDYDALLVTVSGLSSVDEGMGLFSSSNILIAQIGTYRSSLSGTVHTDFINYLDETAQAKIDFTCS